MEANWPFLHSGNKYAHNVVILAAYFQLLADIQFNYWLIFNLITDILTTAHGVHDMENRKWFLLHQIFKLLWINALNLNELFTEKIYIMQAQIIGKNYIPVYHHNYYTL